MAAGHFLVTVEVPLEVSVAVVLPVGRVLASMTAAPFKLVLRMPLLPHLGLAPAACAPEGSFSGPGILLLLANVTQ